MNGVQMQENICAAGAGSELCLHIHAAIVTAASVQLLVAQRAAALIPAASGHPGYSNILRSGQRKPSFKEAACNNSSIATAQTSWWPAWPPLVIVFHCHQEQKMSPFGSFTSYTTLRVRVCTSVQCAVYPHGQRSPLLPEQC